MADTVQETATDLIVRAMERADEMEQVIVVYKLRDVPDDAAGVGWASNATTFDALALMEMAKHGLLSRGQD